jgi:hypothetical protein
MLGSRFLARSSRPAWLAREPVLVDSTLWQKLVTFLWSSKRQMWTSSVLLLADPPVALSLIVECD